MPLTRHAALAKDRATANASPSFQHRHFAAVAAILRGTNDLANYGPVCRHFATELAHTNPRFDRGRFLAACGVAP